MTGNGFGDVFGRAGGGTGATRSGGGAGKLDPSDSGIAGVGGMSAGRCGSGSGGGSAVVKGGGSAAATNDASSEGKTDVTDA